MKLRGKFSSQMSRAKGQRFRKTFATTLPPYFLLGAPQNDGRCDMPGMSYLERAFRQHRQTTKEFGRPLADLPIPRGGTTGITPLMIPGDMTNPVRLCPWGKWPFAGPGSRQGIHSKIRLCHLEYIEICTLPPCTSARRLCYESSRIRGR